MTAEKAWSKLSDYLRASGEKEEYAPETIAECADSYVFSIRPKAKPPGSSTGINPYVVYKLTGKVVNDPQLKIVSKMRPIKMIDPTTIR